MLFNIIFTRFERQFIIAIHNNFYIAVISHTHYCTSIQYVVRGFYAMHHDRPLACEIITRLRDFVTSICVRFYYLSHVYFEAQRKRITCRCLTNTEVGWWDRDGAVVIEDTVFHRNSESSSASEWEKERERSQLCVVLVLQARLYGDCGWVVCPPPPSASAYVKEQHSRGKQELFIAQHCRALTGGGRHVCVCVCAAESKGVSRQCV